MAITYPRALPSVLKMVQADFRIMWGTTEPEYTVGGKAQVIDFADPYWQCVIKSSDLTMTDFETLMAWIDTLKGGVKTFLAHPGTRPRPAAYASDAAVTALTRAGGGAFDGTFAITSIPDVNSIVSTNPVSLKAPAGLVLKAGDYLSFTQSGRYSLHRVVEDVTSNGSGNFTAGVTPILVEPWIKTSLFTTSAIVNILKPLGEFFLTWSSVSGESNPRVAPISFTGVSKVQA